VAADEAAQFFTPAIITFSIVNACFTSVAMTVSTARDEGVLKRVRGTPLPGWAYLVARMLQAVIDTNVVFEGVTIQGSAPGLIVEAWLSQVFVACVSNALAYEYTDVLARKLAPARWRRLQPIVGTLLAQARFVPVYFSWRPMSPDPGDDHVIDCAMNAGVSVVTANVRDFRLAQQTLGLVVLTPVDFVTRLAQM